MLKGNMKITRNLNSRAEYYKVSANVQITNLLMGKIYGMDMVWMHNIHVNMLYFIYVAGPNENSNVDLIAFALWIDD